MLGPNHRRTCCVYCGKRIPGALHPSDYQGDARERARQRIAARFACADHRNLVANDPMLPLYWQQLEQHVPSPTERAEASGVG